MPDMIIEPVIMADDVEKMKIINAYSIKNNNIKNNEFKDISVNIRPSNSLYSAILDTVKDSLHIYLDLSGIGYNNMECAILSYVDEYRTDHTITLMMRYVL